MVYMLKLQQALSEMMACMLKLQQALSEINVSRNKRC